MARGRSSGVRRAALALGAMLLLSEATGRAQEGISSRPDFIDPALLGWTLPLQRIAFEAGARGLYYVSAIYLGPRRTLHIVSRSKITLRRFEHEKLQRYADRLAASLEPVVIDMGKKGIADSVSFRFYSAYSQGDLMTVDIYDACQPSRGYSFSAPLPLCIVERRKTEKWTPW